MFPLPVPMLIAFVAELVPRLMVPVCPVAPIVIVAAIFPAMTVLPPDPDCNVREAEAVVDPTVTTFAAPSLAIPTALPPPTNEKLPAPAVMVMAPEEPPITVVAVPVALRLTFPTAVRAVKVPAAGVPDPVAGGLAKT